MAIFFTNENLKKFSSGQRNFRFIYPTGFFAKIQESFYRQVRIVHEIVDTKNR